MKNPPVYSLSFCSPLFKIVLMAITILSGNNIYAVNYEWNNSGTDWNTAVDWTPSSGIPSAGGDVAVFDTARVLNPNISSSVTISRIAANSAFATGYTLSSSPGASLRLGSSNMGTSSAISYTPTSGNFAVSAPIILGAAAGSTQAFNVAAAGGTVSVSGAITSLNNVKLQKLGAGTLELSSSSNSYSGETVVSAGTLLLSGAGTLGTGGLTMSSGAFDISAISASSYTLGSALSGAGTLQGGGKTLAVSGLDAAGTLSAADITLSLAGTSTFDFSSSAFGAGTYDLVQGSAGTTELVNFEGTLSLVFAGGGYSNGSTVRIFDVDGYSGSFSTVNFSGLAIGQSATFDSATGYITVVPEPGTFALLGVGLMGLLARYHRTLKATC